MDVIIDRMHPLGIKTTTSTTRSSTDKSYSISWTQTYCIEFIGRPQKTFAWVVWYIPFRSRHPLNVDNCKCNIVSVWFKMILLSFSWCKLPYLDLKTFVLVFIFNILCKYSQYYDIQNHYTLLNLLIFDTYLLVINNWSMAIEILVILEQQ